MSPYRHDEDTHIRQAASDLVQLVWPGFSGNLVAALRTLADLERRTHRSPGVRAIIDAARDHESMRGGQ